MLYEKRISLDPRLSRLAELVGTCSVCADIGSDHGRLGAFLLQCNRCDRVILTDISAPSLEKARRLIAMLGLEGRAAFCVGDGAAALHERADAVVIAGMGGDTIAQIIRTSDGHLRGARLILQPNVAAEQLRRTLCECGWKITEECLVRDGRRIYPIITAVEGQMTLTDAEMIIGPILAGVSTPERRDYRAFRIRVLEKALQGAEQGVDGQMRQKLLRELDAWKELEET